MAGRPIKEGLDYFSFDCQDSTEIKLIQAEYGLKGFALVVKLFQRIFGTHGYYCEWDNDNALLFASENGSFSESDKNLIESVVSACVRRGIFDREMYQKYSILTSADIQERYLLAAQKRPKFEFLEQYLLISVPENRINSEEIPINSELMAINSEEIQQRKEKESKEKKRNILAPPRQAAGASPFSRSENALTKSGKPDNARFCTDVIEYLNQKTGRKFKSSIDKTNRLIQARQKEGFSLEDFKTVIDKKCAQWLKDPEMDKFLRPETLFGTKFDGYLNESADLKPRVKGNKFTNYSQRKYDYADIERKNWEALKREVGI